MKKVKIIIAVLLVVALGITGFGYYKYSELKKANLFDLLQAGNTWQIKSKIALEPNINQLQNGVSPLMLASLLQKDIEVFQAFFKAGADINLKGDKGISALMLAASVQGPDVISLFINAGADVNAASDEGFTPLIFAADNNLNPDVIKTLATAGADVNYANADGKSVLLSAAVNNRNPDVLRQIIDSGAQIDDNLFMTLIVTKANADSIKVMIEKGADVNFQDQEGFTPLIAAVTEAFSTEIVQALLDAGANPNIAVNDGMTPLMLAAKRSDEPLALRIIKASGKTVDDAEYSDMKEAIEQDQRALEAVNLGIVQLLIKAGADVNARSNEDKTALDYASTQQSGTRIIDALTKASIKAITPTSN